MDKLLSVVIPAYNEQENIARTARVIGGILQENAIPHELVFVDDGSRDDTWQEIQTAAQTQPAVRGVQFSRNFGKEAAIMAGLQEARGDACVVIDCDLQHPPERIPEMVRLWEQGYEIVEGVKSSRGNENKLHTLCAGAFYALISRATGLNMASSSDFKLLDRKAVDAVLSLGEKAPFFRALSAWVGFRTVTVYFDVQERTAGESKWSPRALVRYAIHNITAFSSAPMHLVTVLGIIMLGIAAVFGGIALVQKCMGVALEGFTTVIILQLFTGSITMISVGIVGYYISRIYEEVKNRPAYIIRNRCGEHVDD